MSNVDGSSSERSFLSVLPALHGYAFAILAPLLWAGNFVIGRVFADVDAVFLNYSRWLVAGIFLLPILILHARAVRSAVRESGGSLLVLSVLGIVSFNTLLYTGLQNTDAGLAGVLFGLTPLFINMLSGIWGQQGVSRQTWTGTMIAFAGVIFILGNPGNDGDSVGAGLIFVLMASFVFALYSVGLNRLQIPLRADACLAVTVWLGLIIMTPFAVSQSKSWQELWQMPGAIPAIAYLGVGASVLAFYAWQFGIRTHGAQRTGAFLHLVPVFGVIFGIMFLDEAASAHKFLGLALVASGVFLAQRQKVS